MKSNKIIMIILIIILMGACGLLGWYFGFNQASLNNSKNNEKENQQQVEKEDSNKESESTNESEIVNFNKEEANDYLEGLLLAYQVVYIADDDTIIEPSRRNQTELLDAKTKLKLAWYYVFGKGSSDKYKEELNPYGEEVTGSDGVELNFFKEFYKKMFDEELPENTDYSVLGYDKDMIKNNYLYGIRASGIPNIYTAFKANSITKIGDNYELLIDVIHEDVDDNDDNSTIDQYLESKITSYPSEFIIYHIKITYKIINNNYVMKSIVAY